MRGSIIGFVLVRTPFTRLKSLVQLTSRHADIAASAWGPPHNGFLCSLEVIDSTQIDPVTAIGAQAIGSAPKADMFQLDGNFVQRLRARTNKIEEWEALAGEPLTWALQLPGPFCTLAVQGAWRTLVHPLPSIHCTYLALFGGVVDRDEVTLNMAGAISKDMVLSPEPLRHLLYTIGRMVSHGAGRLEGDADDANPNIMLEGYPAHRPNIPKDRI